MDENPAGSGYKWYMLALAALTHAFVVAVPTMCMPVLFEEISQDLGLNLIEIGAVWGLGSLSGVLTGLLGGSIGDRYGTKRTLAVACLLTGIAGALRGFSNDFVTLSATILLFGFLSAAVPMNVHKVCGVWFSGRRLGLANGVVSAGMALGFAVGSMVSATFLSPLLGGWRNVLFFYGLISIAISIPWVLARSAPGEGETSGGESAVSMRRAFLDVARMKNIWLLSVVIFGIGGCIQGLLGYLPLYLREVGWSPVSADGALTAFHTISMFSTIPLTMLSDRLGSRKKILVIATLVTVLGTGLLSIAEVPIVWGAVLMTGVFRDGFMAIFMTSIIELDGVGATYAGTAIGLIMVFSRLGSLVAPPLGNSLVAFGLGTPFVFWSAMAAVALLGFLFIKEERKSSLPAERAAALPST